MIERKDLFQIPFYQKEAYTGSYHNMRFKVFKKEERLAAVIWPGPYCFDKTPEEQKKSADFAFSGEGLDEAVKWLNEQYEEGTAVWSSARSC